MSIARHISLLLIAAFALLAPMPAATQTVAQTEEYKFDLGAGIGMSGYLGDVNDSFMFSHPGVDCNVALRYLANTRLTVRAVAGVSTLSGSSADMQNALPGGNVTDFSSTFYHLSARGEFNFFNYGIGESYKQLKRFTPFLAVGIGGGVATSDGNTAFGLILPMSVGIKYKLKHRLNLALEFTMTKVFSDKIDSPALDDPYLIQSSFLKNTDWTSGITLSLSYEFGRRCVACNRQD